MTNPDIQIAKEALVNFLNNMNTRSFQQASLSYGGPLDALKEWNPQVDPNDKVALLASGCGLLRCLRVKEVVEEKQITPTEFRFLVQFSDTNGNLYVRHPCCGDEEMEPESNFKYSVIKTEAGEFKVMDLPPYEA